MGNLVKSSCSCGMHSVDAADSGKWEGQLACKAPSQSYTYSSILTMGLMRVAFICAINAILEMPCAVTDTRYIHGCVLESLPVWTDV
jgi:hypothetical protein